MRKTLLSMLVLLALGDSSRASAHDPPQGIQLVWKSDAPDEFPIVVTNRGLIFSDDKGPSFSLRCNEAYGVTTSYHPFVRWNAASSTLLMGTDQRVVTTADRACSFQVRHDLSATGVVLGGMTQSAAEPDRLLLSTLLNGGGGEVWTSPDLGLTWTLLATNAAKELYPALLAAPSDAQRIYAKGYRVDTVHSTLTFTWVRSSDGGQNWQAHDLSAETTPVAVHPSQPDIVFAYEFANADGTQVHLLRSEDAGDSFTPVITLTSVTSFAATPDGSELWVGAGGDGGGLYHSSDGGKTFKRSHTEFLKVSCLAYHGDVLWMCANHAPSLDGIWKLDKGATSFENELTFDQVREPVACAGSGADAGNGGDAAAADNVCSVPWLDWELEIFPYDGGASGVQDAGVGDVGTGGNLDGGVLSQDSGTALDPAPSADAGAVLAHHRSSGGCALQSSARFNAALFGLLASLCLWRTRRRR